MAIRAVRGATTADTNTKEAIFAATEELIKEIIRANSLADDDMIDIMFTVTSDITATFPAAAVRRMGITDVPLTDTAAPDIDGGLGMCIRVLIHIDTDKPRSDIKHIYQKGAKNLRPDLSSHARISVAIDGPAGAGKSSVAKRVAQDMGYIYIDTGAMYRTVGVYGLKNGIDVTADPQLIVPFLDDIKITVNYENGSQRMYLGGEDVTDRIRENDAAMAASAVATVAQVRSRLVAMQQDMSRRGGVIMDGRDIGTVVLPHAELKIYLTASVHERAMRRYKEYIEKGMECDLKALEQDVLQRDHQDMNRAVNPLRQADDAVLLDTSDMDFEQSVAAIEDMIRKAESGRA